MKTLKTYKIFVLACLIIFASLNVSAQAKWTTVRSQNFHLIGDAPVKDIQKVATKLEQFRFVFASLFPSFKFTTPVETTVIVFKNDRSFRPYKPVNSEGKTNKWVAGYFQGGEDSNYIVLPADGTDARMYETIFHEYVHYLVNNTFPRSSIPPWFNEGLAEYYDKFAIENDIKVKLGGLSDGHLMTLNNTKLIPLEQFFKMNHYSMKNLGGHSVNIFYAQAWAFMHMLLQGDREKGSRQLMLFLNSVLKGEDQQQAFEKAFETTYPEMEKRLKKYVEQRSFMATLVTFKEKLIFDNTMTDQPLSESDASGYLGDLLYKMQRYDEAEALLAKAIQADPKSQMANAALGMVKMKQRKFGEAKSYFKAALEVEDPMHVVMYRYAYTLSRESMNEHSFVRSYPEANLAEMRKYLDQAIKKKPDFPESYHLSAFISLVSGDRNDQAIEHISTAIRLSPGNQYYILVLASLRSAKGEYDTATNLANVVLNAASDEEVRQYARSVISNIEMYKSNAERMNDMRSVSGGSGGTTRLIVRSGGDGEEYKPPTEEELKKMQEDAMRDGLIRELRVPEAVEKRFIGSLSKIECNRSGVIFHVKGPDGMIKLQNKDFNDIRFISFVPMDDMMLACAEMKNEFYAVITYDPGTASKNTSGRLVSLEVVPEWFKSLDQ